MLFAVVLAATTIGTIAALFGAWLIASNGRHLRHRGAAVGVFSAGILVGLSLLSMLPDAMETLQDEYNWRTSHVMLVFLMSAGSMFLLEHVIFTHEHANWPAAPKTTSTLASQDGATPSAAALDMSPNAAASASAAAAAAAQADATPATDIEMLGCVPCDDEPETEGAEAEGGPAGAPINAPPALNFARGRSSKAGGRHEKLSEAVGKRAIGRAGTPWRKAQRSTSIPPPDDPVAWWAASSVDCECCAEGEGGDGTHVTPDEGGGLPTSKDGSAELESYADGTSMALLQIPGGWCGHVRLILAGALRQAAWIMHAAVDGMVVGSVPRASLLAPAAFAVGVCALQDALAYSVFLMRRRAAKRLVTVALVLFGLAFPVGAAIACVLQSNLHSTGQQGLALVRVVMAAVFCYMATELAPAHTHSKCTNLAHALTFGLGVAAAGAAELFEGVATEQGAVDAGASLMNSTS